MAGQRRVQVSQQPWQPIFTSAFMSILHSTPLHPTPLHSYPGSQTLATIQEGYGPGDVLGFAIHLPQRASTRVLPVQTQRSHTVCCPSLLLCFVCVHPQSKHARFKTLPRVCVNVCVSLSLSLSLCLSCCCAVLHLGLFMLFVCFAGCCRL